MSALSRARLERYDSDLSAVEGAAEEVATREGLWWRAENPEATVAEVRDHVKALVVDVLDRYGDAAGELAARLYDEQAESAGTDVPPAEIPDVGEAALDAIDSRARYLVGRIAGNGGREDI